MKRRRSSQGRACGGDGGSRTPVWSYSITSSSQTWSAQGVASQAGKRTRSPAMASPPCRHARVMSAYDQVRLRDSRNRTFGRHAGDRMATSRVTREPWQAPSRGTPKRSRTAPLRRRWQLSSSDLFYGRFRNPVCRSKTSKPSILVIPVYSSPRRMSRSISRRFSTSFLSWAFRPRQRPKRSLM